MNKYYGSLVCKSLSLIRWIVVSALVQGMMCPFFCVERKVGSRNVLLEKVHELYAEDYAMLQTMPSVNMSTWVMPPPHLSEPQRKHNLKEAVAHKSQATHEEREAARENRRAEIAALKQRIQEARRPPNPPK